MKVRRLVNHDWTFGSNLSNYIKDSEATKQRVITTLLSFKNDWFLDLDHGIDWWTHFSKNPDVGYIEDDIRRNVQGVTGVESVIDIALMLNTETRKLTAVVTYKDIYGETETVNQIVRDNQ